MVYTIGTLATDCPVTMTTATTTLTEAPNEIVWVVVIVEVAAVDAPIGKVVAEFGPTAAPPETEVEVIEDVVLLVEDPAEFGATPAPAELEVVFEKGA